jgi:hypothetical protein
MSDPMKDAWNEVAEGFAKLGGAMKDRYRGEASGGEAAAAPAPDQLREAFERLVEAGRDVGQRSVEVLRDADVNAQARQAATSLNDALAATVDMIGNEVGRWFGRDGTTTATVDDTPEPVDPHGRDADPEVAAAMIDQQLEDAEGVVDDPSPDAPGTRATPPE